MPGLAWARQAQPQQRGGAAAFGRPERRFFQTDHGYHDGIHIVAPDRTRPGFVPTPMIASNRAFGGTHGRRLFTAATKLLLAIDPIG